MLSRSTLAAIMWALLVLGLATWQHEYARSNPNWPLDRMEYSISDALKRALSTDDRR